MPTAEPDDDRRFLRLEGVRNARDLGGYSTQDGRTVRWGRVYRTGALGEATPRDIERLREIGLRVVCDLRSGPERVAAPDRWPQACGLDVWGQPEAEEVGDSQALLAACLVHAAQTRAVMTQAYRTMPYLQTAAFAAVFSRLARGEAPLLFHCSAGKDRSGGAAALLLLALGVPRATVRQDYLLSNLDFEALRRDFLLNPRHAAANRDSSCAWLPLIDSDPGYFEALIDAIYSRYETIDGYLAAELGVGSPELGALRGHLLE